MFKLLRNRWLWLTLLIVLLTMLGAGIYHVQELAPLCVIHGNWTPLGFADNGRRLVVVIPPHEANLEHDRQGRLGILDVNTGVEIARHFSQDQIPSCTAISKDGRFVVAEVFENDDEDENTATSSLFLLDTTTNQMRELPLGKGFSGAPSFEFADNGSLLIRSLAGGQKGLRIWETESGRLIHEESIEKLGRRRSKSPPREDHVDEDFLVYEIGAGKSANSLDFWDVKERRKIGTIAKAGHFLGVSRDWSYCVSALNGLPDGVGSPQWWVWDLKTTSFDKVVIKDKIFLRGLEAKLSADARWMATINWDDDGRFVELRSLTNPKASKKQYLSEPRHIRFSPDGSVLVVSHMTSTIKAFSVPNLEELWSNSNHKEDDLAFSIDSSTVFLCSPDQSSVVAVETRTGRERSKFTFPQINGRWIHVNLTSVNDGRNLLVNATSDDLPVSPWLKWVTWINSSFSARKQLLLIIDVEPCRERFRLMRAGDSALLSDNGRTLATVHSTEPAGHIIYCWDTEGWKPLGWSFGVPAALGVALGAFVWWRGKRSEKTPLGQ